MTEQNEQARKERRERRKSRSTESNIETQNSVNKEEQDERSQQSSSNDKQQVKRGHDVSLNDPACSVMLTNMAIYSIYRKLLLVAIFCTIVLGVGFIGIFSYTTEEVKANYLPVNVAGSVIKEYPLNEQGEILDGDILSNSIEVVNILNTYDYINWRNQVIKASKYFTPDAWQVFQQQLEASETFKTVENEQSIVSIQLTGDPKVEKRVMDDVFVWKTTIPITVTYKGHNLASSKRSVPLMQKGDVEIYYTRTTIAENPRQYAIFTYRFNVSK